MQKANIELLIEMPQFPIEQPQQPIRGHHQPIDTGTEQQQQEGNPNYRVDHAEYLSAVTNRRHVAVTNGRNHCRGEEQTLSEAPIQLVRAVLECRDSVLAGHNYCFEKVLQLRF